MARPIAKRPNWRNSPDEISLSMSTRDWKPAESLCPSSSTTERAVCGDALAREIVDAWQFKPVISLVVANA